MFAHADVNVCDDALTVDVSGDVASRKQGTRYSLGQLRPFTLAANASCSTELLEFMVALYTVDRLLARPRHGWARKITIQFPVESPDRWNSAKPILQELISRSMGDDLDLIFTLRPPKQIHCDSRLQHLVLESQPNVAIGLLSDGLDSLCGVTQSLAHCQAHYAFVSVLTNSRRKSRINRIRAELRKHFGEGVRFHDVDLNFLRPPVEQERTQRSRTLLAIAAGITLAAHYDAADLEIYENGVGLLNLPVPNLQMPHESSQALHPSNTRLWADLSARLSHNVALSFPNRWLTKAQMCDRLSPDIRHLVSSTSSCDSPQRVDASADCGTCGSCIIRRIALKASGLGGIDCTYSSIAARTDFEAEAVFRYHASLLSRVLNSDDPWPALIRLQPTIAASLPGHLDKHERAHAITNTLALLRQHVNEMALLEDLAHAV